MDEEVMPYKKRSKKKPPKKANHAHEWESVILSYWNKYYKFNKETGFIGGIDECAGKQCKICGKLEIGFPKGSVEEQALFTGTYLMSDTIYTNKKFADVKRVKVNDMFKLQPLD